MRRARCLVLSVAFPTLHSSAAFGDETVIPAADPPAVHAFSVEGAGAGSVFYLRLSLKPSVGAAVSLPEGDEGDLPGAALSTYLRVGEKGEIFTLDGDGSGGGTWLATGYVTPLDIDGGGGIPGVGRPGYRVDLAAGRYDLFLGRELSTHGLGFARAGLGRVSRLLVHGGTEGSTAVRDVAAGPPTPDADLDGLTDAYEAAHGLDPADPADRAGDPDGDGLANIEESRLGTAASSADSDGDGLPDGWEAAGGLDPLDPAGEHGAGGDPDGDGLTNAQEFRLGADPRAPDAACHQLQLFDGETLIGTR